MRKLRARIARGRNVIARGGPWTVVDTEPFEHCTLVTLRGTGDDNFGETARLITPFDVVDVPSVRAGITTAGRHPTLMAAARAVASAYRWDECWTAATARIELLPWQLEPARAAVIGATRILLADAVGLGKTIQAALVLSELRARRLVTRTLILTPAALQHQWAHELSDRFALDVTVFDHAGILQASAALPPGINPWNTADVIVSSIDLVKRPEVRAAVDAAPFDLLIVDEAHHVVPDTDRGGLVASLAARVPWLVLATATPHSGDDRAYTFLQSLGSLNGDGLRVFRRSSSDAGRASDRRVHLLGITPAGPERALLTETLAYTRMLWKSPETQFTRLVASVIARRAASSAHAAFRTLVRRRALLAGARELERPQPSLPWEECDVSDADQPDHILGASGLRDGAREIAILDRLIDLASLARGGESKRRVLTRFLRRANEPALVFSEYRDTVEDLAEATTDLGGVAVLHGGLGASERRAVVERFVHGHIRLLYATDTAGEGLNLQSGCRLVINLELPWNPIRLEQRIGRVDRLGQTKRVHALQLYYRDSFEDHVLAALSRRLKRAHATLADDAPPQSAVAAAILGDEALTSSPRRRKENRPRQSSSFGGIVARRLRTISIADISPSASESLVCGLERTPWQSSALVLLYAQGFFGGDGRILQRDLIPLHVVFSRCLGDHAITDVVSALLSNQGIRALLAQEAARHVTALRALTTGAADQWTTRLRAIIDELDASQRRGLVQTSLFDRRAERLALVRDATYKVLRQHLRDRLTTVASLQTIATDAPRLVVAWPIE